MPISTMQDLPNSKPNAAEAGDIATLTKQASPVDPFVDGCGRELYYRSEALHQRIELINHLIEFARQIVVVTGTAGAGKSALLEQIGTVEHGSWNVIRFSARGIIDRPSLLNTIAAALKIEIDLRAKYDVLGTIRTHLRKAAGDGQLCIAIIDDTNTLTSACLPCLYELATAGDESEQLRIVLALDITRSTLLNELQSLAPAETLVHVVEIPQTNEQDTSKMLQHRWQNVYDGDSIPLSDLEMAQIHRQSNGVAGKAIALARQVRTLNDDRLAPGSANRLRTASVAALGLIIAVALVVYKAPDKAPTEIELVRPAKRPVPAAAQAPLAVTQTIPVAGPSAGHLEDRGAGQVLTPAANDEVAGQRRRKLESSTADNSASKLLPDVMPGSAEPPPAYSLRWLQRQNKSGYVLQLFGVRDRGAATTFIRDNALAGKSTIFATEHSQAPWFAVLYGHYPNRDEAQAAISDLPAKLRTTKPWARPLISLE